jgi:hypothetical protein
MAETVKKAKAPAKPRKATTKKTGTTAEVASISIHNHTPSHDQIAELARKYWAERGYTDGQQEEDWFRAEQELRAKAS